MKKPPRIAVFFSKGRALADVLRAVRAWHPDGWIRAVVPAGYPVAEEERALADDIEETELARYGVGDAAALFRLVGRLRAERYDGFVILFDSTKLRLLSALAAPSRRLYCALDGTPREIRSSVLSTLAYVAFRHVWGRLAYAGIYLIVRALPVRRR